MTSPHATPPPLLIGCAAGFSGDRIDAAGPVVQELIRQRQPAVLIFETLAERLEEGLALGDGRAAGELR